MNDTIYEAIVSTRAPDGRAHAAPMGIRYREDTAGRPQVLLMPFRPSATLDHILHGRCAVLNRVVDGRVYAGCITGRRDWPQRPALHVDCGVLEAALSHAELRLARIEDDAQRPRLWFDVVHEAQHAPFLGLNRAQAAVVEGAVLVSRLHLLPADKIRREFAWLQIAIDKTARPQEHEAWSWLRAAVDAHLAAQAGGVDAVDAADDPLRPTGLGGSSRWVEP
ncbi:MAG: hypothetical protein RLY78_2691 [Pseudomonadota bacterium]|jgi:hypothetical protein|uniref:DUF447 domain-containing protein n=1 Tax=Pseudaquabacterium rugosum TaxID=2984194 RepID=A0ABU9B8F5_9BURK